MALPSHVGLSIIDGFAAGLPVLVANFDNHCPEIAYLEENVNGLMTLSQKKPMQRQLLDYIKIPVYCTQ